MPTFSAQLPLFRAYDIRGDRQYFTPEFIQALGVAFAHLYDIQNHQQANPAKRKDCTVVIGYDVRYGSDTIAHTLADILSWHGITVIPLGLITTPMMVFWAQRYDGHGIMVTASHSEKDTLGIKWTLKGQSPSREDIQSLYKSLATIDVPNPSTAHSSLSASRHNTAADHVIKPTATAIIDTYIEAIADVFCHIKQQNGNISRNSSATDKLDLMVVIDCMNGATGHIAQPLFTRFCQRVMVLNDEPDGSFPSGNPDPTEPNRLAELQQTVMVTEADIGLAFDGDGDRLMVVDNRGKVVNPDHLLYLLAQIAISEYPDTTQASADLQVLFDVKCSHHLPRLLKENGASPIMGKTGSSIMRQQLHSHYRQAIFAGELSGHFIFNDRYFIIHDDAMYAGLRLLHWLASAQIATYISTFGYTDTSSIPAHSLASFNTDSWGASKRASLPYRLTDITQHLPILVSTADTYLPLPDGPTCCSIVERLTNLCHYLQTVSVQQTNSWHKEPKASNDDLNMPLPDSTQTKATVHTVLCGCLNEWPEWIAAQAQQLIPVGTSITCIDGVRLDFAHGFGVLRQSNTSHSLTVRFAGDSLADMKDVQARFEALCRILDPQIAAQIAAISPE